MIRIDLTLCPDVVAIDTLDQQRLSKLCCVTTVPGPLHLGGCMANVDIPIVRTLLRVSVDSVVTVTKTYSYPLSS